MQAIEVETKKRTPGQKLGAMPFNGGPGYGVTVREVFAAQVLMGVATRHSVGEFSAKSSAVEAVEATDALLEELDR